MTDATDHAHRPVMLGEVLELLLNDANGFYVDATFGRGGHSRALLEHLGPSARLVGIDRDPDALAAQRELESTDPRFRGHAARFDCLERVVTEEQRPLTGVLMDLGLSSPQVEDSRRGFSFLRDGPLDMRMDPEQGPSAAEWLARAPADEIANVLYQYGEERKSRRIARAICRQRAERSLDTTVQLADLVEKVLGKADAGKHPATRTFQAIRIYLNGELEALDKALEQAVDELAPGGRLVVISFHSLEDRRVKRLIRDESGGAPRGRGGLPPGAERPVRLRSLGRPRHASSAEIAGNPRARSAVLRAAEKVAA
jgi:16S rRNA (cytosine1402-N4)-methyltransferase